MKLRERERRLQAAAEWAQEQSMNRWNSLPITDSPYEDTLFAVKTATGRVLTGTARVFKPLTLDYIRHDPRYGAPTAFLQIDPRVYA